MKLVPLGNRVLVRMSKAKDKTEGGILLPDMAKEKPRTGEVLAVGPGRTNSDGTLIAMSVKKGQVVLFNQWGGSDVPGEDDLKIIGEDEILGIVE